MGRYEFARRDRWQWLPIGWRRRLAEERVDDLTPGRIIVPLPFQIA